MASEEPPCKSAERNLLVVVLNACKSSSLLLPSTEQKKAIIAVLQHNAANKYTLHSYSTIEKDEKPTFR
jgi:hypothetical protein